MFISITASRPEIEVSDSLQKRLYMAVLSKPTSDSRLRPLSYNGEEFDEFICAVIAKAEGLLGGRRLYEWQARAVWALLKKRDLFVKAGTGSGKSKVFQTMIEAKENGIVLVIVPLKVLMEDQVRKVQRFFVF
jgi:superfamily II DNA helicase RecQ